MNNQKLPEIAMSKSGHKRSRFNFSHDVNTTADFGSVQPAQVRSVVPYSKMSVSTRSLTRLAPMVAPAFGRLKLKLYHEFVAMKDICRSFDAVMSQTPQYSVSDGSVSYKSTFPNINLKLLTFLTLIGAKVTLYKLDGLGGYVSFDQNSNASVVTEFTTAANSYLGIGYISSDQVTGNTGDTRMVITGAQFGTSKLNVPLCNAADTFDVNGINYNRQIDLGYVNLSGQNGNNAVPLESADYVFEFDAQDGKIFAAAFRLSSVGKRLRKIFIGCGYQMDLGAGPNVNLLPLFAYFKAYWNLFGLTQWQNWETTSLSKLIDFLVANDISGFVNANFSDATFGTEFVALWMAFVRDLCFTFYTDNVDYVSSHLPSTAISPTTADMPFVDVNNADNVTEVDNAGAADGTPSSAVNGHSFISQLEHGELDSEYLKRLYKWTNRNTVIGRKIGEILRAQGLGKYVDSCKTDFIGYTDDYITISDVVSTADTGSTGKLLGEYGGRGLQLTEGKTFTYETDEFGYWITLMVVVPECGYMQQLDPSVLALKKFDLPNPEFDSMGYEARSKRIVQGARDWNYSKNANGVLDATFGYAPRYFGFKFSPNVNNGDVTLRGTRDNYLPYTLDKFIDMGSPRLVSKTGLVQYKYERQLTPNDLPIAGNAYRFVGRYPWLGNFNRIFANVGEPLSGHAIHFADASLDWWFANNYDNFLISSVFNVIGWCPMIAVEDSFETEDEEGKSDMKVNKA